VSSYIVKTCFTVNFVRRAAGFSAPFFFSLPEVISILVFLVSFLLSSGRPRHGFRCRSVCPPTGTSWTLVLPPSERVLHLSAVAAFFPLNLPATSIGGLCHYPCGGRYLARPLRLSISGQFAPPQRPSLFFVPRDAFPRAIIGFSLLFPTEHPRGPGAGSLPRIKSGYSERHWSIHLTLWHGYYPSFFFMSIWFFFFFTPSLFFPEGWRFCFFCTSFPGILFFFPREFCLPPPHTMCAFLRPAVTHVRYLFLRG